MCKNRQPKGLRRSKTRHLKVHLNLSVPIDQLVTHTMIAWHWIGASWTTIMSIISLAEASTARFLREQILQTIKSVSSKFWSLCESKSNTERSRFYKHSTVGQTSSKSSTSYETQPRKRPLSSSSTSPMSTLKYWIASLITWTSGCTHTWSWRHFIPCNN